MSTTTTNFGLIKFDNSDPADITQLNESMDKIDNQLAGLDAKIDTEIDIISTDLTNVNAELDSIYADLGDIDTELTSVNEKLSDSEELLDKAIYPLELSKKSVKSLTEFKQLMYEISKQCKDNVVCTATVEVTNHGELPDGNWLVEMWKDPFSHIYYLTLSRGNTVYSVDMIWVDNFVDFTDFVRKPKLSDITPITYGTTDLQAGTSTLTTGSLYFVYE